MTRILDRVHFSSFSFFFFFIFISFLLLFFFFRLREHFTELSFLCFCSTDADQAFTSFTIPLFAHLACEKKRFSFSGMNNEAIFFRV